MGGRFSVSLLHGPSPGEVGGRSEPGTLGGGRTRSGKCGGSAPAGPAFLPLGSGEKRT